MPDNNNEKQYFGILLYILPGFVIVKEITWSIKKINQNTFWNPTVLICHKYKLVEWHLASQLAGEHIISK